MSQRDATCGIAVIGVARRTNRLPERADGFHSRATLCCMCAETFAGAMIDDDEDCCGPLIGHAPADQEMVDIASERGHCVRA